MAQVSPAVQTVIIAGGYNASQQNNNQPTIYVSNSYQRNKLQSNATAAGGLIFLSAGLNMALSLGWSQFSFFSGALHFYYSWFIGIIIGVILAVPLRQVVPKKFMFGASALLILVEGIIFTSLPLNYDAVLTGRYLNGIAIGLSTVIYLMVASEVAIDSKRGGSIAVEQYSISLGLALQMIYVSYWNLYDFPVIRLHGIFDIVFAAVAALLLIFYVESPIDQIRLGQESDARQTLGNLQRSGIVTLETQAWLEQCKAYVREHESMSFSTCMHLSAWPLVKMLFFRSVMLAFCYSMPLNILLQYSLLINASSWVPTVAGCCRVFGSVITLIVADKLRRKIPSLFWMICMGGLLIGMGSIFRNILVAVLDSNSMYTASILYIIIQLCAGFYTPYTSILLAEAFPLRVKGNMMDICVIVEQLIQIIMINTINVHMGDALMAQGIIIVVTFAAMIVSLPETKGTSLAEAQRRFRKPLYTKCQ